MINHDKILNQCADYDSMGNHGRFPMPKNTKRSLLNRIIKLSNNFFYVNRR